MTYLDLVNNVLRRMREETVSSVSSTTYSTMVGDFVNDAKNLVETAWDWSGLRGTLVFPTVADQSLYSLTNSKDYGKVLNIINDTSNVFLEYQTSNWFDNKLYNNETVSSSPHYYTYRGLDTNDDTQIEVYPVPDDVYSLRVSWVVRNGLLTNDLDTLKIPHLPVLHLAVALLARERGETGGTSAAEYFNIADKFLSDAIALDAQKHPEETIWQTI